MGRKMNVVLKIMPIELQKRTLFSRQKPFLYKIGFCPEENAQFNEKIGLFPENNADFDENVDVFLKTMWI